MSADREFDHLENMSDMNGSGHYSPGQYAFTREQDAELAKQKAEKEQK